MIRYFKGNILKSKAYILVNPVNCIGIMGRGLALEFKKRYLYNYYAYVKACKSKIVLPGNLFFYNEKDKCIANFPTKINWRDDSKLSYIEDGLNDLVRKILYERKQCGKCSVAIPALGCGCGGLDWDIVLPLIELKISVLPDDIDIEIYTPI